MCWSSFRIRAGRCIWGMCGFMRLGIRWRGFTACGAIMCCIRMGYDSFGLPAENAAIKHGVMPDEWTEKCIGIMKGQQKRLGLSYDWGSRGVD